MPELAPLNWSEEKPVVKAPAKTVTRDVPLDFKWPTPPYAAYPQAVVQTAPEPCEILGLNNSRSPGHVILMAPHERLAQINVPPARNAMPLRFSQFRALKLLRPVAVGPRSAADNDSALSIDQRPRSDFTLHFVGGGELQGTTIGYLHDDLGLFLFPPVSADDDSVLRVFVPAEVLDHFDIGERIGDVLVKEKAATHAQIEAAANEQADMRSRRVGDILIAKQIVTAEQLVNAIEAQAKMPMIRIGEALLAMELITEEQLNEALAQQRLDRSVPLGELLVRKGVVSRLALQSALARKMGYPLVDVDTFPAEPDAINKLPYAVAKRLEVLPLMLREGRMIVAMEDPTRRDALDEIEFITQLKITPTLAKIGTLQFAIPSAYERFSGESISRSEMSLPSLNLDLSNDTSGKLMETLEREHTDFDNSSSNDDTAIEQSDNSLVRLINTMIIEAQGMGASDIHIETQPGKEKLRIRFRKDGVMQPYLELPHTYRSAMIARLISRSRRSLNQNSATGNVIDALQPRGMVRLARNRAKARAWTA